MNDNENNTKLRVPDMETIPNDNNIPTVPDDDDDDLEEKKPFCISLLLSLFVGIFGAVIALSALETVEINAINELTFLFVKIIVVYAPVFNFLGLVIKKSSFALTGMLLYIAVGVCVSETTAWVVYGIAIILSLLGYAKLYDWEEMK